MLKNLAGFSSDVRLVSTSCGSATVVTEEGVPSPTGKGDNLHLVPKYRRRGAVPPLLRVPSLYNDDVSTGTAFCLLYMYMCLFD